MRLVTVLLAVLCPISIASLAVADPAGFERGLGVYTSLTGFDRTADLPPGPTAFVHVRTDDFRVLGFDGLITAQFSVVLDPRLEVVGTFPTMDALLVSNPAPNEWQIGLQQCAETGDHPVTLVSYEVRIADGVTDISDLRVGVGPLTSLGEPMLYGMCREPELLQIFANAGGAVLNPSDPAIVHFSCEPDLVVEGRSLTLAWESIATATSLDGSPVANVGQTTLTPLVTTTYMLDATTGLETATATKTVEVIREPRVVRFIAQPIDTGSGIKAQLAWDVRGADVVDIPEVPGNQFPWGAALVPIVDPPIWELTATNEWGETSVLAGISLGDEPPLILSFTANPNPFRAGSTVTLTYSLFGATAASIAPDVGTVPSTSGSIVVDPGVSTTYTLVASNAFGTVSTDLLVQLLPPGIQGFTADPPEVFGGFPTTLTWDTDPGLDLEITPDVGVVPAPVGSVEVTPPAADTEYTLTASNAEGSVSTSVVVGWKPPEAALTAESETPFATDGASLTATIAGALSATLEPGFGVIDPLGGTFQTLLTQPTTFTLTATNLAGIVTSQVTVDPQPPAVSITASDETPFRDESVTLTVEIEGADAATLEPGIGAVDPAGGEFIVQVDEPTLFVATATNAVGSTSDNVLIVPSRPIVELTAAAESVLPDEPVVLTATLQGADSATLNPGFGAIAPEGGTFETFITETTTFILTGTNAAGSETAAVTVGLLAPLIDDFSADLPQTIVGQPVLLSWDVRGADEISIEPGGFLSTDLVGSFEVNPTETTTYTLTATNIAGQSTAEVTVEVQPFAIVSFTTDATSVTPTETVTLSWEVIGVADVVLEPLGPVDLVGTVGLQVSSTTTFVLRATNSAFEQTRALTVFVSIPGENGLVMSWSPVVIPGMPPPQLLFVPFDVYVLGVGLGADIAGFEFSMNIPPCLIVLSSVIPLNPSGAINVGAIGNWVIGLGQCVPNDTLLPLVKLTFFIVDVSCPEATVLSLGPSYPSSFAGLSPGYVDCNTNLIPFNVGPDFPLIDDDTPVVPAVVLHLQARGTEQGVELTWDVPGLTPTSVRILRARTGEEYEPLTTLTNVGSRGHWVDESARPEIAYTYVAVAETRAGSIGSQPVEAQRPAGAPALATRLLPNRPNPFNPSTELRFAMGDAGSAKLSLYDLSGRLVRTFRFDGLTGGEHQITWDATDEAGHRVASGVYIVRLETATSRDTRRVTLLK